MLISKNFGSFTKRELGRAYEHLSLTGSEREAAGVVVVDLEKELTRSAMSA